MKRFTILSSRLAVAASTCLSTLGMAASVDFMRDIAPVLSTHCAECHGPNVQKGKVSLVTRAHLLGDAAWKKVLVPGKPDASKLIAMVSGDEPEMPEKGAKLTAGEVEKLRQWIADGAVWPEGYALKERLHASPSLWSLQPVKRPVIPETPRQFGGSRRKEAQGSARTAPAGASEPESSHAGYDRAQPSSITHPIDRFVEAKLAEAGLTPAPAADPRTLIRRMTFDMLGLPPTPEEVGAFQAAFLQHPESSIQNLVTRLLASPHYGERWARHWLDIAHYADTHGFERDQKRENAWPYRDWVIRAFNDDMPYDEFIRLQLAGDVIAPQSREAVIATGFLAAGPWDFVGQMETPSPVLKRQARADDLDDMVTQVITSTMGLTINCARCHSHKLDPIPQEDYYQLVACFAGVKRGERELDLPDAEGLSKTRNELASHAEELERKIARLSGEALKLADIAGGGDGRDKGKPGSGFDPNTGKNAQFKQGFIENVQTNLFHSVLEREGKDLFPLLDGVVIPDGSKPVPITSTGITVSDVPPTSGKAWDAIRNGPVNSQASTMLNGVDYATEGHSLIGIHANAAMTFDLQPVRQRLGHGALRFTALVGYGGAQPNTCADFHVFADGKLAARRMKFGTDDGGTAVDITIAADARFLTLMATDGGDGISHDQVFFADPKLAPAQPASDLTKAQRSQLAAWQFDLDLTRQQLNSLPKPGKLYAVLSETAPVVKVLARGNPEAPLDEVTPGALSCLPMLPHVAGDNTLPEGERRKRLADWIASPRNPLTARVMVNRLWHHHFGKGLVDTPSDFGNGGGRPTHPELLDWLAMEFIENGWSVKHMQRLIVTSEAYRRASQVADRAVSSDSANRLLARMNPRRLDAESLRDAVLAVSGCLNLSAGGPGYQDFDYQDAYAPIYKHITADKPELWRRSVYRFIVRTTPQRFLTTLDCPNPANLTPARLTTTTALQSLALMNNEFMLQQAEHFAARVKRESGDVEEKQIKRAFGLAFQRAPDAEELRGAAELVKTQSLAALCRVLFNANEFVHVD